MLKVASANVKTLDPVGVRRARKLGLNISGKMEYLDGALAAAGYHIMGGTDFIRFFIRLIHPVFHPD